MILSCFKKTATVFVIVICQSSITRLCKLEIDWLCNNILISMKWNYLSDLLKDFCLISPQFPQLPSRDLSEIPWMSCKNSWRYHQSAEIRLLGIFFCTFKISNYSTLRKIWSPGNIFFTFPNWNFKWVRNFV